MKIRRLGSDVNRKVARPFQKKSGWSVFARHFSERKAQAYVKRIYHSLCLKGIELYACIALEDRMKLSIATLVLLSAVASLGQLQPPAISVLYHHVSPTDMQRDLEFLRVGLHPAFGEGYTGGGISIGVYHTDRQEPDYTPPVLFYAPDPAYPAGAAAKGKTSVRVWFIVWLDGTPHYIRVVRSAGEQFDAAAIAAVRKWRYYPGAKAGRVSFFDFNADVAFVPPSQTGHR